MKSILYVGATLMIGASVYGFVDYKQTRNKKEFKEMYAQEKAITPVEIISGKTTAPLVKKEADSYRIVSNEKKAVIKKQAVSKEEPFISIKPIAEDEKMAPDKTIAFGKSTVNIKVSNESGVEKKLKKKRKFSTKLFSRGALDERYIEPKEKVELPKKEVKKSENKEQ